jgi:putative transcriptional regulator
VIVAVAAMVVASIGASPGRCDEPRLAGADLTGQLLVATPEMKDPRFAHTVIYMVRHTPDGAQGLVLNRPLGEIPLTVLLGQFGIPRGSVEEDIRLHSGGPVDSFRILVLHTADYSGEGTTAVKDGIAVTSDPSILSAITQGKGPRRMFFAVGYSGWAPGQLDAEMKTGAWARAPASEVLIFDTDYATKWERAMARRKIDL